LGDQRPIVDGVGGAATFHQWVVHQRTLGHWVLHQRSVVPAAFAQFSDHNKKNWEKLLGLKPGDCLTLAKTWLRTQYVFGARLRRDRPLLVDDDTGLYTTL